MSFADPIDPPDPEERMGAADLKNKVCLFRPQAWGEWPAKDAELDEEGRTVKKAQGPRPYVECDVWVLDRAGIVESGAGIRVSWWRAVKQLEPVALGSFILAQPVEQQDRSVVLVKTNKQEWRDIAATAVKEVDATATVVTAGGKESLAEAAGRVRGELDAEVDGTEPF